MARQRQGRSITTAAPTSSSNSGEGHAGALGPAFQQLEMLISLSNEKQEMTAYWPHQLLLL